MCGETFKGYKVISNYEAVMLLYTFLHQLTDITFLVGDTREPVCAVRAVLAARSFYDADGNGKGDNDGDE